MVADLRSGDLSHCPFASRLDAHDAAILRSLHLRANPRRATEVEVCVWYGTLCSDASSNTIMLSHSLAPSRPSYHPPLSCPGRADHLTSSPTAQHLMTEHEVRKPGSKPWGNYMWPRFACVHTVHHDACLLTVPLVPTLTLSPSFRSISFSLWHGGVGRRSEVKISLRCFCLFACLAIWLAVTGRVRPDAGVSGHHPA